MCTESRHLSVHIDRPFADVYAFASDPANLPLLAQVDPSTGYIE